MLLRIWWYVTLLLAALGLVMGGAHVLELPVRARYDAELYMRVTSTMYLYFGLIGGPVQVLAFTAAAGLAMLARRRQRWWAVLAGAGFLLLSLILWAALVQPVNAAWAEALRSHPSEAVEAYARLRQRWEFGHVAAFAAWLAGFAVLLYAVTAGASPASIGSARHDYRET